MNGKERSLMITDNHVIFFLEMVNEVSRIQKTPAEKLDEKEKLQSRYI